MLEQEKILLNALKYEDDLEKIYEYSKTQIAWISHERLVHLLITLYFGMLVLISVFAAVILRYILLGVLFAILTIVFMFYIVHYYRLENGVQRLYKISNQIYNKINKKDDK
ncbi:MAG TPA: hypothetical protein GXZ70_08725 [Clostridiales bacterium]|nr:hypothetical protein [Clostridiales bacterium]